MRHEFDIVTKAVKEVTPRVRQKLVKALDAMACDFRVNETDMCLSVSEVGFSHYRVSGVISINVLTRAWQKYEPSTSRHPSDHVMHAGRYLLNGVEVQATVSLPAINCEALDVADCLVKATQFAQILRATEHYFNALLETQVEIMGETFLASPQEK